MLRECISSLFFNIASFCFFVVFGYKSAFCLPLEDAILLVLESNPEIGEAIENKIGVDFELLQAHGQGKPKIFFSGSMGLEKIHSPIEHKDGKEISQLLSLSTELRQPIFDFSRSRRQIDHQKARTSAAQSRIIERSELLGLEVARDYFQILQQKEIIELARSNFSFHQKLAEDVGLGKSGGRLTERDYLQAQERLTAAESYLIEAKESLTKVESNFMRLVGHPVNKTSMPPVLSRYLPKSLGVALSLASKNNPVLLSSKSDIEVAQEQMRVVQSESGPRLDFIARVSGRFRSDRDGSFDIQANSGIYAELNWPLFDSGISLNRNREYSARLNGQVMKFHSVLRRVHNDVRIAWNRLEKQRELVKTLEMREKFSADLLRSYQERFLIGQQSILDLLDAQNSHFSIAVLLLSARYAVSFAEYRLLASTGELLNSLGLSGHVITLGR